MKRVIIYLVSCVFLFILTFCIRQAPEAKNNPEFEAFSFDRSQYYYNAYGHDYIKEEIDSLVRDFSEVGFTGAMLELEWEYNATLPGLGRGWYAPTNGDSILGRYLRDERVTQDFISSANSYGLKVSIIISSLNDRIGTNDSGYTDPFSGGYPTWIYPNEKAFDLFKRKVDIIATLDVDEICIDFARTPYNATSYNDDVIAVLLLTNNQIDYIKTNYPELEVSVAVNPTYRGGVSQNADSIKMHGAKVYHWENHDYKYTLGVESSDEGYFIYPVKPSSWWDVGGWTPVEIAEVLVYGTSASPGIVFLHTPLSHDDYLVYSVSGVIQPGHGNHCPVIEPIDDIVVEENDLITIVVNATDVDNDSLVYHINDPRFEQEYNIFTWQTQEGDEGKYDATISVTDTYCSDSQTINITILSAPKAFSLISPNGDTLADEVILYWQESIDTSPGDSVLYCIYCSTSDIFDSNLTTEICGLNDTSYSIFGDVNLYSTQHWKVKAYDTYGLETWSDQTYTFFPYVTMDTNCDGTSSIADVVYKINFLFKGGMAPCIFQVADHNCDGWVTITDIVCEINFHFKDGPTSCCP